MRKLFFVLFFSLAMACNKDEDPEKYSSINGYWIIRTPDGLTDLTFRIGVDADNVQVIDAVSLTHNGTAYTQAIDAELAINSSSEIESISFRGTNFTIRLWTISVNGDFTEMQIANSSFVIDQVFHEYPMLQASRK